MGRSTEGGSTQIDRANLQVAFARIETETALCLVLDCGFKEEEQARALHKWLPRFCAKLPPRFSSAVAVQLVQSVSYFPTLYTISPDPLLCRCRP